MSRRRPYDAKQMNVSQTERYNTRINTIRHNGLWGYSDREMSNNFNLWNWSRELYNFVTRNKSFCIFVPRLSSSHQTLFLIDSHPRRPVTP